MEGGMADERDPDRKLTLEAREAVRAYVLKLAALPVVAVSILSFALGFGVNEAARGAAYAAAYSAASKSALDQVAAAAHAGSKADSARERIERIEARLETVSNRANKSATAVEQELKRVQAFSAEKLSEMATALAKDGGFRTSLANVSNEQLATLGKEVGSLARRLEWKDVTASAGPFNPSCEYKFVLQSDGDLSFSGGFGASVGDVLTPSLVARGQAAMVIAGVHHVRVFAPSKARLIIGNETKTLTIRTLERCIS
jgi:hypothetical protein